MKKIHVISMVLGAVLFLSVVMPITIQADKTPPGIHGSITVGNGIYNVTVEDIGPGNGTYTVATANNHPYPNQSVLYDGSYQLPWSSYLTVRDYTSLIEYYSVDDTPAASPTFNNVSLDPFHVSTTQHGGTNISTIWNTDGILINQTVAVEGTTFANSRVRVTTNITNMQTSGFISVGIRYEWDLMIDGEDGSWFAERNLDGAWLGTENTWISPSFEQYELINDPNSPIFSIFGTVNGPASFVPPPTPPDVLMFAAWGSTPSPGVYDYAFDFTTTGRQISGTDNDSAIAYYWGNNRTNAIEIPSGGSYGVTQYLYVTEPPSPRGPGGVGGNILPVDKIGLLLPYIAMVFSAVTLVAFAVIGSRYRK